MPLSNKYEGIRDLLKKRGITVWKLRSELIKNEVPGTNWSTVKNAYNLANGAYPNDAYTFIFLSELLDVNLSVILLRYSLRNMNIMTEEKEKEYVRRHETVNIDNDDLF